MLPFRGSVLVLVTATLLFSFLNLNDFVNAINDDSDIESEDSTVSQFGATDPEETEVCSEGSCLDEEDQERARERAKKYQSQENSRSEDLMEDEIKELQKTAKANKKLMKGKQNKDSSKGKKQVVPDLPERPGRKKGDPKPIVLNSESNTITLDPSQIRIVEDDASESLKKKTSEQANKAADKKSKSQAKKKKDKTSKESKNQKKSSKAEGNTKSDEAKSGEKVNKFKAQYQKTISPKKVFIDGRRIPAVELLHQKESNSSVKVYMFNEFFSERECDGLVESHKRHVKAMDQQPILCFNSIQTLKKHISDSGRTVDASDKDFTKGTTCLNTTFSGQLQEWMKSNWSYSTSFYPEESKFSKVMDARIQQAMGLSPENGGKFQVTSYPIGKAYKAHTDCVIGANDKRDRVATVLIYLNDAEDGGETDFPDLGIWVRPRKGRALLWNNMSPSGYCEPDSRHEAKMVKAGSKYIIIRWYYYKSFATLGKRQNPPPIPPRTDNQAMVMCDEYENGSCRWYDEWSFDALVDYRRNVA